MLMSCTHAGFSAVVKLLHSPARGQLRIAWSTHAPLHSAPPSDPPKICLEYCQEGPGTSSLGLEPPKENAWALDWTSEPSSFEGP